MSSTVFPNPHARLAGRNARLQASNRGHTVDRFRREAGRPVAMCGCGYYVFVDRDAAGYFWGYGRLPIPTATSWAECSAHA